MIWYFIKATYTNLRSLWLIFCHLWRKKDTISYPEHAWPATCAQWPAR